jgi:hypothetical protein
MELNNFNLSSSEVSLIYVLSGNCRTFIDCIDSCYEHIISKLFLGKKCNIIIYLYLKLTDPGPRDDSNHHYEDIEYISLINKIKLKYGLIVEYKLLSNNEISDNELLLQVKDRKKYIGRHYGNDHTLLRGLHCHYNFECCGKYILEKEEYNKNKFDYIIYIRPDLYFTGDCENINNYDNTKITLGKGLNDYANDHLAIIPREHFTSFFFDRMATYRNNTEYYFETPETVYWHSIKYNVKSIGTYYIKRA